MEKPVDKPPTREVKLRPTRKSEKLNGTHLKVVPPVENQDTASPQRKPELARNDKQVHVWRGRI